MSTNVFLHSRLYDDKTAQDLTLPLKKNKKIIKTDNPMIWHFTLN